MNENNLVYSRVFMWMFVGLFITFITAYSVSMDIEMVIRIGQMNMLLWLATLGIAIFLGARIHKMNIITVKICFLLFSLIVGLTFSTLFIIYELESLISVFAVTSVLFLIFAIYGHTTKRDVTKMGPIIGMMVIGIIIMSVVNAFLRSASFDFFIGILGVPVFIGLLVYNMKSMKGLVHSVGEDKGAVYGAFILYVNFINLFVSILRVIGRRR